MNRRAAHVLAVAALLSLGCGLLSAPRRAATAAPAPITIRLSVDEDPIVPRLAESLGYFKDAGIHIVRAKVEDFSKEDYPLQAPLRKGRIDAAYHWFNHAVFGARHNLPVMGVMVFNDAPGMTVLVAERERGTVRSAADFRGKRVAEGALYGTKALLTTLLATRAGLSPHSFTPVVTQKDGREAAVQRALRAGQVDVMTFEEPMTSTLRATGLVSTLYDLNSKATTTAALGAAWPAQSLLVAPSFIARHPDRVQRLVTAFVRTMRFIDTHSVEQIAAALPASYFTGKDREATIREIRRALPTFAHGDYAFSPAAVRLVLQGVESYGFDSSAEGHWRATSVVSTVDPTLLYTNRFVDEAMREAP
jgi:NitT/TauT family transport system substrate-binding protein